MYPRRMSCCTSSGRKRIARGPSRTIGNSPRLTIRRMVRSARPSTSATSCAVRSGATCSRSSGLAVSCDAMLLHRPCQPLRGRASPHARRRVHGSARSIAAPLRLFLAARVSRARPGPQPVLGPAIGPRGDPFPFPSRCQIAIVPARLVAVAQASGSQHVDVLSLEYRLSQPQRREMGSGRRRATRAVAAAPPSLVPLRAHRARAAPPMQAARRRFTVER